MKKIPSVWVRDFDKPGAPYSTAVTPGCEWVLAGEGVATRKWDGTACLIANGALFVRFDAKNGKPPPDNFWPAQEPDPATGHWPGWIPADGNKAAKWSIEAWRNTPGASDGTYEAVGPAINANRDRQDGHVLRRHGDTPYPDAPRGFESLKEYLSRLYVEGVVFHHPDGRMAKATRNGFGLPWGRKP